MREVQSQAKFDLSDATVTSKGQRAVNEFSPNEEVDISAEIRARFKTVFEIKSTALSAPPGSKPLNLDEQGLEWNVLLMAIPELLPHCRGFKALNTGDFFTSEKRMIADKGMTQSSARHASHLGAFSRWLNENLGLILDYQPAFRPRSDFGQLATDSERSLKLIPDEVIGQILSLNAKHDMALRDRFFLSAFTISVATGLRSIELMTLPFDCLLNDGSSLMLRVSKRFIKVMVNRPDHIGVHENRQTSEVVLHRNRHPECMIALRNALGLCHVQTTTPLPASKPIPEPVERIPVQSVARRLRSSLQTIAMRAFCAPKTPDRSMVAISSRPKGVPAPCNSDHEGSFRATHPWNLPIDQG